MFITLDNNQRFYELFEKGVQKGLLYHVFFWVVFFFFLVIVDHDGVDLGAEMLNKALRVAFYIVIVYTNLNYLFPKYLKTNKLFTYLLLLILLVVVATPIEVILHFLISNYGNISFIEFFSIENNSKVFLGSFFVGFSSSIYKIINDWMEHQRERMDLQRQNLTSELKYLKTQINPHFFFNTLNSLYALTLKKSDKAPEIVLKLSDMMRYMLYESNERMIALNQEIKYMQNYLELEQVRQGESLDVDMEIIGDPKGHEIAPLLFIPFLENCFKHGINNDIKSGYVKIKLEILSDALKLKVINSLPGQRTYSHDQNRVGGIGLTNVRRRLNILYPKRHKLEINKTTEEFIVSLELKFAKQIQKATTT